MDSLAPAFMQHIIVEVRYKRGLVYFDRCGACALRILDKLGPGFEPVTPTMNTGELKNDAERLNVRFSHEALTVVAQWPESHVRTMQVARDAWEQLSEAFDVRNQASRIGVRLATFFPCGSGRSPDELLYESEMIRETRAWTDLFGSPQTRQLVTLVKHRTHAVRIELGGVKLDIRVPAGMTANFLPATTGPALLMDLDFSQEEEQLELPVTPPRLSDFIRNAARDAKQHRESLKKVLIPTVENN